MDEAGKKTYLKQWLPPAFLTILKRNQPFGWKGDFKSWDDAAKMTTSYDNDSILEKAKFALLKVKNGESVYERDTVLFDKPEYSWPLLSTLLWISNLNNNRLKVFDFGGSLGSSYYQNKSFLNAIQDLQWNIVEQKNFVTCGKQFFKDERLNFFYTADEMMKDEGIPDLLLLSCVLPYLEKPYEILSGLMSYRIPYILIDNTYFNYENRDRICVQRVPPEIYDASYPCWMLNYEHVRETLNTAYQFVSSHYNESTIFLDGKKIRYKGILYKIRE